jgi:hypothetical protein
MDKASTKPFEILYRSSAAMPEDSQPGKQHAGSFNVRLAGSSQLQVQAPLEYSCPPLLSFYPLLPDKVLYLVVFRLLLCLAFSR